MRVPTMVTLNFSNICNSYFKMMMKKMKMDERVR
jgi:hypothetical protein